MSKSTRSTKIKEDPDDSKKSKINSSVPLALCKVFFISEDILGNESDKLKLERFYHPGKEKPALFLTKENNRIMEILEFSEPRRSWLIDSEVCSNGHIYITTPIDATFLALHHLRKHCQKRALALDNINDEEDPSVMKIINNFVDPTNLKCLADIKTAGGDMTFYKYNHDKAMAWLALKTKRVAKALKTNGIYCGNSAVSENFARSEKAIDETAQDTDYLRVACDYVGGYISLDLHEELIQLLNIPSEIRAITEEKKTTGKRKFGDKLNTVTKKQKTDNGVTTMLRNSDISDVEKYYDKDEENKLNSSNNEKIESKSVPATMAPPQKERSFNAKEKSLAKSAKGTKSIASFFAKKVA